MSTSDATLAPTRAERHQKPRPASDFRPDIQGLRAIAVGLVVLYHLWPKRLSGGYVGVDVFFVISGFLITSHIHREIVSTGHLRVTRFWARRIRRLLPASLLVLVLSGLGVLLFAPSTTWAQTAREIAASALYVQNWQLATSAVDYMALDNVPTVAQHFWSLSVEEQFYAVWPVLILGLLAVMRLRGHRDTRKAVLAGLALLSVASLTWSVVSTLQDQAFAYMSTFTRVWEFAAGGITALALVSLRRPGATVAAWLGLAAVVGSGSVLTEASLFPGWVALFPVLGTVALLVSGAETPVGRVLATRPMTFVGDISYSVYLVHWPLIVLVPHLTGHPLRWTEKLLILVATLGLAWLSKTWVEDPLRTGPLLSKAPRRAFVFALTAMALVVGSTTTWGAVLEQREQRAATEAAQRIEAGERCLGPRALVPEDGCSSVAGDGPLVSPPEAVVAQSKDPLFTRCQQSLGNPALLDCVLGDPSGAKGTIALVGDSHAGALIPTVDELGKRRGLKVVVHTKGSCPATDARRTVEGETSDERQASCTAYNAAVDEALLADASVSLVLTSSYTRAYGWEGTGDGPETGIAGFASRYERWRSAGKQVVVIADVPATAGEPVPNCIAQHLNDPEACAVPRAEAVVPDLAVSAAERAGAPVVDLNDLFCDAASCYSQVGDVIVYRDRSHLSIEYARMLAPFLDSRLR
ncbi:hypothetical protein N798_09755 [Knoellia flava TL1]|uniref:Acyltransferase n=2 Tax=Knoellia flava TaxID=913969 RepID=A0A8H9FW59_9MICO|nr:acyltransferase family protein [Knoellia flava]KGN30930.1 hypothetical protein N798_09755 [Knoellia flava TL1]GGB84352.1 acyltransferase [Knoellia flava]